MANRIKQSIYLVLYFLFSYGFIKQDPKSSFMLYYSISIAVGVGSIFLITRYLVISKSSWSKWLILLGSGLVIAYVTSSYLFSGYDADLSGRTEIGYLSIMFHPIIFTEVIPYPVAAAVFGLIASINIKSRLLRQSIPYIVGVLLLTAGGLSLKYFIDVTYNGDDNIHFIDDKFETLTDLIAQPQFNNKVVYIDFWFSTCSPCIEDFQHLPELKKLLETYEVEYLYLGHPISAPNTYQLWKSAIKKYHLVGWHVFMDDQLENNIRKLINGNSDKKFEFYPRYLLVNQQNKIVDYNATRPPETKQIVEQIKQLIGN